jgi:NADP-dependent 3-hydroxy acid dehydrogenase YdfG
MQRRHAPIIADGPDLCDLGQDSIMTTNLKYALVTGASSGIGAATARALAAAGYQVIAAARRADRLAELGSERIEARILDVTSQQSVDELAAYLFDKNLEVIVANAGGAFDANTIVEADLDTWQKTYEVNVIGAVRTIKALVPGMSEGGHVVIMGSTAGRGVYEGGGSYTAAKHAVAAMAETLRLELNGLPIRVTEIAPGMVHSDEFAVVRFGGDKERAAKVYEGVAEPLVPEDIADVVVWCVTRPAHVNVDLLVVRPVAQAAAHKVHRIIPPK